MKRTMLVTTLAAVAACTMCLAKDLTWNGGAGGTWDDTSATWLDGETPCAWEDGATAVFSGSGLVAVKGEIRAGGIRFTTTGTALVGDGLILLDGAVDAAIGTFNSISTRLYADPAMSKTGRGTVSLAYTRGAFAIEAGTVCAGGFNMLNTSVTVSPGAVLQRVSGGDKAATLLANGSFETPARSTTSGWYANVTPTAGTGNMPTGWSVATVPGSNGFIVPANAIGQKNTWGNALPTVPDGNVILALQYSGAISQTVTVPADGFYDLSFYMFRRGNYSSHQLYLYMDGLFWQPLYDSLHSGTPTVVDTGAIWLSAGPHTVKIAGEGYWGDTTTFIDDLVFAEPTLTEATSIPVSSGVVVDVASGEQTFADAYSLAEDVHKFRRFTKAGAGKAIFTQNLAIGGATIYDVEGEAEYAGTFTGTANLHKRGTGALTLTTPGTPAFKLENGSLRVKNFTSSMNVAYRVDQGVTAGFYPGLASGDASIDSMTFAGNGTCAFGTLGDGRTLTVSGGGTLNTPTVLFDVGAGDTIKFGNLRAALVGNEKSFVDTAIVKAGSGTLALTTAPTCYAPTAFTVREGTLAVAFDDKSYAFSYTRVNMSDISTNTYGLLRTAALPLALGDRNSPARSAVTLRLDKDGFTSPRPIIANWQPASVTLDVATGSATLSGTLEVYRSVLSLTGAEGAALSLGNVTTDEEGAELALDENLSLSLDGTLGAGISLSAPAAAGFNVKKGASGAVAFANLALGGNVTVDFDANGHDAVAVSGTLTLGATAFTLNDALDGSDLAHSGRYVLATFGTFSGDVADLSVANPVAGYTYAFAAADGKLTLTIAAEESNPIYTWTGGATGDWTDAGNWDHATVPDGADKTVTFYGCPAAVTATLAGAATVGGIVNESAAGVTLAGGTIAFAASGTPEIRSKAGTLTITSALAGSGAVTVAAAPGARVVIDGPVACGLVLDGVGVALGPNAVLAKGVMVKRAGTVRLDGGTAADAGLHGLVGRYWRASIDNAHLPLVTDWRAFKAHAQAGAFVTEALMDNAEGFLVDDSTYMNLPEELQGNAATANNWIGIWEGYVTIPAAGRYGFRLECDDHALLAIDGKNVTQCVWNQANSAFLDLPAGAHRIFAGLYDSSSTSTLSVYVMLPDGTEQALPLAWLTPEMSADAFVGTGTLAPETVLTVAPTNGVSAWTGTLDANGALAKTGASGFDTKLAKGSLVAAEGLLAATTTGAADGVAVAPGATVALAAGGTVKGLSGGGTFAAGAHAYGFPISNDADCGISSAKTYTHKVNVCGDGYPNTGVSPVATVNGVTFQNLAAALGGGKFDSNIRSALSNQPSAANPRTDWTDPQPDDSGLRLLLRTLGYAGKTNWVEMSGLTPGKVYDFRAYYRPYGNSDRNFLHCFETGGKVVASIAWDTNTGGGVSVSDPSITRGYSVVGCRYTAGADGKIILRTYKVNVADSNGYHVYAFTNEEVTDAATGVTLAPEGEGAFEGEVTGDATVTVSGTGSQLFAGGVAAPLAVTGTVVLDGGAAATGGVTVAQGGVLEMRPGSAAGALSGAGTVRLAHGEHGLRGALQADGTFAAPAFPQRVFFTGDDDCGISSGKRYAHAWNFGMDAVWATLVNGAQLAPFYRNRTPKDGRRFVSMDNNFGGGEPSGGGYSPAAGSEGIAQLLRGMAYSNKSNEMNFVDGLVAGKEYELRMYNRAWDKAHLRQCIFTCDPFGAGTVQYDFNENDSDTPSYVAFRIRPSGTSFKLVGRSDQTSNYPHFYGATIEEVADYARAVDSDEDATFAGAVTGLGAFTKRGAGVQTFSGAVAATGPWTVEAGGLMLANAQASISNVAVLAGATFGGFGKVTGDVGVAAGGRLALDAAGTLEVGGRMVVAAGAALDVAFNADGTGAGRLAVAGSLALPDDLTINVSGSETPQTRRNLLTATGGITGDTTGWTVNDAAGNVLSKARVNLSGNSLTLALDTGTVLIFR